MTSTNGNIFNCNPGGDDGIVKDKIILEIGDSQTGEDVTPNFEVDITLPEGETCPTGCTKSKELQCACEDLSVFEPGA